MLTEQLNCKKTETLTQIRQSNFRMRFQQIQLLITDKQTTTKLANCIKVKMAEF